MDHGLTIPARWIRDLEGAPDPVEGEETIGGKPAPSTTKPDAPPSDEDQ